MTDNNTEDFAELERKMEECARSEGSTILVCPECGSAGITYFMGMKTGVQYQCKDCGYVGAFILELDRD